MTLAESAIGAQIRVVTTFGEEIDGELFCCDMGEKTSNTVVICQRLETGNVNYKILKGNVIKEVKVTSDRSEPVDDWLPHVDLQLLGRKVQKLEEIAAKEAKKYGVGVTEQAQEVFDALNKTMEPEWDGEDIQVLGVRIKKPYDPAKNIEGPEEAVDRIRKVLQNELGRIRTKKQQQSK
mmetsp:Transcript_23247/g.37189  ORF Transcript_23247/g.37189 Transcript_23247/m.37189 type:complete len:179 (-) Transcript_23247:55-591(-)|eukprot:CAMPEP_0169083450 /NCGR_PEP_ID=MMETSP1015-20121227/12086_1 /TAXON_ID=342587 /ORGANISM="Karlodinium micrum, Strain CCMP2283" /LENGTH=178 /DNA_ID=CAMNT_0009143377 /DNA_START=133 /DNA_END=669 /DNA_ORIENTATION=+